MKTKQDVIQLTEKTRKLLERMGALKNSGDPTEKGSASQNSEFNHNSIDTSTNKNDEDISLQKIANTVELLQAEVNLFNNIQGLPTMTTEMLKASYKSFSQFEYGLSLRGENYLFAKYRDLHFQNYDEIFSHLIGKYVDPIYFIIEASKVKIKPDLGFSPGSIQNLTKVRPGTVADAYLKSLKNNTL